MADAVPEGRRSRSRIVVWWDVPKETTEEDRSLETWSPLEAMRAQASARDAGYLSVSLAPNAPLELTIVMGNVLAFHANPYPAADTAENVAAREAAWAARDADDPD